MLVGKFIDLVLQILGRNSQDFATDTREVSSTAELVIGAMTDQMHKADQEIPDGFYTSYVFPLFKDEKRNLLYAAPKPGFVALSDSAGIRSIGYSESEVDSLIIIKAGQLNSIKNLEISTKKMAWTEGEKIFLKNVDPTLSEIRVLMIPKFSELNEDQDIFSNDTIALQVADAVIARLAFKSTPLKEDKSNDNNSD